MPGPSVFDLDPGQTHCPALHAVAPEAFPLILENRNALPVSNQSGPPGLNYDFVVLDTELTGLNRRRDESCPMAGAYPRPCAFDLADALPQPGAAPRHLSN